MTMKRKPDSDSSVVPLKKVKITASQQVPVPPIANPCQELPDADPAQKQQMASKKGSKPRPRINKLKPARPFPTVPTSVSETGPRSAHREGKNMICITRNTSLGAYLRRCKTVVTEDGYKTLNLTALGAAIPLLLQLVCALPSILPFPQDDIRWEVTTGTVEVQDEVIPENEEEDISYQTRCKSNLSIIFKIGDGEFDGDKGAIRRYSAGKSVGKSNDPPRKGQGQKGKGKGKAPDKTTEIVYEEPEQEFMDML